MSASASEGLAYQIWDVFTDRAFAGNPLAVVLGADGMNAAQMQTLAAEFNLAETVFVLAPADPAHKARVRIFTPAYEMPFAGHPTLGCALALSGLTGPGPDAEVALVLEEQAGLVPVRIWRQGGVTRGAFAAPVLPFAAPGDTDPMRAAAALGLTPADLGAPGHPGPARWQGGPAFLYVPLASLDALARARPTEPAWGALMDTTLVGAWCHARSAPGYRARLFAPSAGIAEDPATGSAAAVFAAELHARRLLPATGTTRIAIRQGVEMGRPSDIGLSVTTQGGALARVEVSGQAVPVATGRIRVPGA